MFSICCLACDIVVCQCSLQSLGFWYCQEIALLNAFRAISVVVKTPLFNLYKILQISSLEKCDTFEEVSHDHVW